MEEVNHENGHVCDQKVFLALTQLRLEIAARLLERIISPSWHIDSPYSCEVLGEAFKVLAKAVGEAIEGRANEHWLLMFRSWANHHRQLFASPNGKGREPEVAEHL